MSHRLLCRSVQEPAHRNPPWSLSVRPPRVAQPLPQLHQVHPRSHHQPADADLSGHQVSSAHSLFMFSGSSCSPFRTGPDRDVSSFTETDQLFTPVPVCSFKRLISLHSRNLLSVLPKYLFSLPLKVLLVSNNKLVSIPEEIGKAKELMELVSSSLCRWTRARRVGLTESSHFLSSVSPRRTSAVMRSRCCQLRWGGFRPYESSTSGRTVSTCCPRVSPPSGPPCKHLNKHPIRSNEVMTVYMQS